MDFFCFVSDSGKRKFPPLKKLWIGIKLRTKALLFTKKDKIFCEKKVKYTFLFSKIGTYLQIYFFYFLDKSFTKMIYLRKIKSTFFKVFTQKDNNNNNKKKLTLKGFHSFPIKNATSRT